MFSLPERALDQGMFSLLLFHLQCLYQYQYSLQKLTKGLLNKYLLVLCSPLLYTIAMVVPVCAIAWSGDHVTWLHSKQVLTWIWRWYPCQCFMGGAEKLLQRSQLCEFWHISISEQQRSRCVHGPQAMAADGMTKVLVSPPPR